MSPRPLDRTRTPLGHDAPVPVDRPFTTAEARACGVSRRQLDAWVGTGVLANPLRGVFCAAQIPDSLSLRLEVLRRVVPPDCVVTDRTAGWLWGADMILAPGDHEVVPRAHVFCPPGYRLRNGLAASGERSFLPGEVRELDGMRVTSPLRTACDLGRLLHRDQALAAMDGLARLGFFSVEQLVRAGPRYKRYRGVRQLRALAPLVDPAAQSPGESILRLRWYDVGLPRPVCQVPVPSPYGTTWWVDLGLPEERFGAEYDGVEFHGPEQEAHDAGRRLWLREGQGWRLVVARADNLFGRTQDIEAMLTREAHSRGLLPRNAR